MTDEQRRLTFLRDNVEHLAEEKASLESLLYTMKLGSQDTADTLLRRIRVKDTDVYELAAEVHAEKFRSQGLCRRIRLPYLKFFGVEFV